ncbi:MAG: type II toxin-antitoxin system RelE/ParE family toxin [Candidatus Riflebacteria bacterium]|nr:type II toxin-antitoxin system RelE/ParE family toxin [Candidatus Riflebacteria bacterium]
MVKRKDRTPPKAPSPPSVYQVQVSDAARRELNDLPPTEIERIVDAIQDLVQNPRPPGARKLVGVKAGLRIRKGNYRILYTVDDDARLVRVYRVGHRSSVYKE